MDQQGAENQAVKVDQSKDQGSESAEVSAHESGQETLTHLGETEEQAAARISKEEREASNLHITAAQNRLSHLKLK